MIRWSKRLHASLAARWRRFSDARDGVAAVEFAMILPLMLTMWLGTVEVGQAIAINRKSVLVSRTLADLTSRATTVTNADMNNIFNATTAVIAPFPTSTLGMVVTSVKRNGSSQNLVVWSDARGPGVSPYGVGASITLPNGVLTTANQTVIMAEVKYGYTPTVGYIINQSGFTVNDKTYMVPRQVNEVARTP